MTIASLLAKVETQERHFTEEKEKAILQSKILANEEKSELLARRVEEVTAEHHKYYQSLDPKAGHCNNLYAFRCCHPHLVL